MSAIKLLQEARTALADGLESSGELEAEWSKADRDLVSRIDALLATGGWIPVTERLPELREIYKDSPLQSNDVLVVVDGYKYVMTGVYGETFRQRKRRWEAQCGADVNVTHWQPLPLPPLPDEKE